MRKIRQAAIMIIVAFFGLLTGGCRNINTDSIVGVWVHSCSETGYLTTLCFNKDLTGYEEIESPDSDYHERTELKYVYKKDIHELTVTYEGFYPIVYDAFLDDGGWELVITDDFGVKTVYRRQ